MTWYGYQQSGTVIDFAEWNSMVSSICHKGSEYRSLVMPYGISSQKVSGGIIIGKSLTIGTIVNTEFSYLDGVTSAIQPQLNSKASIALYIASSIARASFKSSSNRWPFASSQYISGGTIKFKQFAGLTNCTATELEQLTDGSVVALHSHGGGGGSGGYPSGPRHSLQYRSGAGSIGMHGGNMELMFDPRTKIFSLSGTMNVKGNINNTYLSSQKISGGIISSKSHISPSGGYVSGSRLITKWYARKPSADTHTGEIIRVSGTGVEKTYVYMAVRSMGGSNQWIQLGISQ